MENLSKRKRIFSAVQPSGVVTLGNYLGAIKRWKELQNCYDSIFSVADLHAITVKQDPKVLRKNILTAYAVYLACGIDPTKSIIFVQSQIQEHTYLAWFLMCHTYFGELSRMTQFKEKTERYPGNVNAGLFTYPCLMAADILLYAAEFVPVGSDQKQHVEIARNIAQRMNLIYGNVFTVPEPLISEFGAKIMSLTEPIKKMSKSSNDKNSFITLFDLPDTIIKKIKRAVTDSFGKVRFSDRPMGIGNLVTIYSCISGESNSVIEEKFRGKGYGAFKEEVAELIIAELSPIREKYLYLMKNRDYLLECAANGAKKARNLAVETVGKVSAALGFDVK